MDDERATDPGVAPERSEAAPAHPERSEAKSRDPHPARQRFPLPWGLFIALVLYAALVAGYLQATYWSSPEYQALEHYDQAWAILGPAEGRTATRQELVIAYEHLLESARLHPHVTRLHEQLERLNWRFEERQLSMPPELRERAGAVAMLWKRIQEEQAPLLVVGARNRGWAPDQLREGPGRAVRWSLLGVLIIVGAWAYIRFSSRRVKEGERELELAGMESEVKQLAGHRPDTDPEGVRLPPPVAPGRRPRR